MFKLDEQALRIGRLRVAAHHAADRTSSSLREMEWANRCLR